MSNLDYFAIEPVLVERVKTLLPELEQVYTPFSVDDMIELSNNALAAHIVYDGDRVGDAVGNGKANAVYQRWYVILAIRDDSAQSGETASIRAIAAPLISKLLHGLQGYNPQINGYRELKRSDGGIGVGHAAGFGYFPFSFEIQMLFT